jgi:hypothetical protein
MAAYPSYGILLDSSQEWESSWRDDISESGSMHSRQMRSSDYIKFTLLHNMTDAEYDALLATFRAAPRDTYTLTYRNVSPTVTYSVKFIAPPQITSNIGGGRYLVKVEMRGTED